MSIFGECPSLLGGTQTFVGVLATLIVLCLFKGKSNFLQGIIVNLSNDLIIDIKRSITLLRQSMLVNDTDSNIQEEIANDYDFWLSLANKEYKQKLNQNRVNADNETDLFFLKANSHINDYSNNLNEFKNKKEDKFISLFTLIIIISVQTIDCVNVNEQVGAFFLLFVTILASFYSFVLWKKFITGANNIEKHKDLSVIKCCLITVLCIILGYFLWTFLMGWFSSHVWVYISFLGCMIFALFALSKNKILNFENSDYYNNRFVAKHSIYIVVMSVLLAIILEISCTEGFLYDFLSGYSNDYLKNWNNNMSYFSDIKIARVIFILFLVFNSFFIPLLSGYAYNVIKANRSTKQIKEEYEISLANIKENKKEYYKLITHIKNNKKNFDDLAGKREQSSFDKM